MVPYTMKTKVVTLKFMVLSKKVYLRSLFNKAMEFASNPPPTPSTQGGGQSDDSYLTFMYTNAT
jgi:hypothetical protein